MQGAAFSPAQGVKNRARLQHIKVLDYACITEMLSWYSPRQMEGDRALACPQPGGSNAVLKSSLRCFITEMSQKLKGAFCFEDLAAVTAPEILKVRVTRKLFYSFLITQYLHAECGQFVFFLSFTRANNQLCLSIPTLWIKAFSSDFNITEVRRTQFAIKLDLSEKIGIEH